MKRFCWIFLTPLLCISVFAADVPQNLSRWFTDLNNPDPAVRQDARQSLMALKRPDLDTLRDIVAHSSSVSPEQITVLHEIVLQVILADVAQSNPSNSRGFLGAQLSDCQVPGEDGKLRPAVLVARCIPGYDAYRMLRVDDVILAVSGNAQIAYNMQSFMMAIQTSTPGQIIHLRILRGGRALDIDVQLFSRPAMADNIPLNIAAPPDPLENQYDRVEQYWRSTFEPIIHTVR